MAGHGGWLRDAASPSYYVALDLRLPVAQVFQRDHVGVAVECTQLVRGVPLAVGAEVAVPDHEPGPARQALATLGGVGDATALGQRDRFFVPAIMV